MKRKIILVQNRDLSVVLHKYKKYQQFPNVRKTADIVLF